METFPRHSQRSSLSPRNESQLQIEQRCPTRLSNQVKVRAETFVAIKSPGSATQLNESYNKFLAKCDFLHRAAHQLVLEDKQSSAAWM